MIDLAAAPTSPANDLLSERVSNALAASPHVPGSQLRVEAAEGSVRLHGSVSTFFEKQMAQELVRRLDGVDRIENLLQVSWT
ncbi:BON domain protein [Posidoniimonas polymericola]|uniref:BON domain protein n=1 Tax=Posidoniimonas polymericola TaxID=2528002 RepID=A0A5C5YTF3_9BACT|nr:BON domain-containing protein [Posidoniimonas polymericola]TWT77927.1 BON domain protein [Posidoniimonas polymericola]